MFEKWDLYISGWPHNFRKQIARFSPDFPCSQFAIVFLHFTVILSSQFEHVIVLNIMQVLSQ